MIRLGLYLEPDTRREWLVVRVRATGPLRALHGTSYLAFQFAGRLACMLLPRPIADVVLDVLRSGCWCRPGWLDRAVPAASAHVLPVRHVDHRSQP